VVVERTRARPCVWVEEPSFPARRHGKSDRAREALAERSSGDLDPRVCRYSGCPGVAESQVRSALRSSNSSP
jgi:hypothetical protein